MMKRTVSDAVSNISAKYIEKAADYSAKKSRKSVWGKIGAVAACLAVAAAGIYALPNGINDPVKLPSNNPYDTSAGDPIGVTSPNDPSGVIADGSKKTIDVIDLSQGNPGEFAGDMHRPEGFNENIGSALALKMSITDDVSYKYSVLIRIPDGSTLEQALSHANESLNMTINTADAVTVNIFGGFDTANRYYYRLTAEQIIALAENGTWCLYIGSGQGENKDMRWDTRDGIDTYCELNGDMYVFADSGIDAHPDIGAGE